MSDNKGIRNKLEKIYGSGCMIERAGIRFIPVSQRKKIKGYRKTDERITYHHIRERSKGGDRSIENEALIKEYNHVWLHSLPEKEKQVVNEQLQQFKLNVLQMKGNGQVIDSQSIVLDFSSIDKDDCIIIPVFNNDRETQSKRKKKKLDKRKELQARVERKERKHHDRQFDDYYYEEDDYEER